MVSTLARVVSPYQISFIVTYFRSFIFTHDFFLSFSWFLSSYSAIQFMLTTVRLQYWWLIDWWLILMTPHITFHAPGMPRRATPAPTTSAFWALNSTQLGLQARSNWWRVATTTPVGMRSILPGIATESLGWTVGQSAKTHRRESSTSGLTRISTSTQTQNLTAPKHQSFSAFLLLGMFNVL